MTFAYATHEVRVVFGAGTLAQLPAELDRARLHSVLLLLTPGRVRQRDLLIESLGHRCAGVYAGATLHVPVEVVAQARAQVNAVGPGALLAFGGGSAIGLGKALAYETKLPLAVVATTYSGSEMTAIWGSTEAHVKRTFRNAEVAPRLVLYDVDLTHDLDPAVSAASGMNAIAHCVEAEYAPESGPVTSWFAMEGIGRLAGSLPAIARDPRDTAARHDALFGAHLAGRALDMTSMGLHHKLAHILGGTFGLNHAQTHAALLPWVAAWNAPDAPAAMGRIAAALGTPDAPNGLLALSRRLGIRTLGAIGFPRDGVAKVVDMTTTMSFPNPRPVTPEGVRWILEQAR